MKLSPGWLVFPLALAFACGTQRTATTIKSTTSQIILKTRVVSIPSDGRIINVLGSSWKLDKRKNKFVELHTGNHLVSDDLVLLKKDSQLIIEFEDESRLTIDPTNYPVEVAEGNFYFTLEKKEK